ncbi:plasma membrane ascorbate-dependent reductase CYBRD1 isoform 2-T2 [Morphnus guianensis]
MEDYGRFLALLVSALLVGFVSVIFSLVWVFHYREGLSWDGGPREFNWHPVLVITGFVFIQGIVPLRAALMPIHVYSGLTVFATVIATALMGITEKLIFSLKNPAYSASPPEATFVNCLGLLLAIFGALILWMASRSHWKRPPEENAKVLQPIGGTPEGTEAESTMTDGSNADKSDLRISSEAARKQNLKLDEAGQRSTM